MTQRSLLPQEVRFANDAATALELLRVTLQREEKFECERMLKRMLLHKTSDGMPYVEPELTDEDAKERPLVYVSESPEFAWSGPRKLVAVAEAGPRFLTSDGIFWKHARRATPEEIAKAGLS